MGFPSIQLNRLNPFNTDRGRTDRRSDPYDPVWTGMKPLNPYEHDDSPCACICMESIAQMGIYAIKLNRLNPFNKARSHTDHRSTRMNPFEPV